jgi:hypothetical protein
LGDNRPGHPVFDQFGGTASARRIDKSRLYFGAPEVSV